jgi:outer membrane protein
MAQELLMLAAKFMVCAGRLAFRAAPLGVSVMLALASNAHAQPLPTTPSPSLDALKPTRAITMSEALAFARTQQPSIRSALARANAQRAVAEIPRAQWLPVFGVTAQLFGSTANNTTGTYDAARLMDIPRIGGTRVVSTGSLQPYASTLVGGGGIQKLFDFGRIAAQSAAADALVDVAQQRVHEQILDVTFGVEEAYFAVFAAKSILKASEDAFERSRVHRDLAKAGVDAGLRSPIELTRAEAELARFDIGSIRARGGLTEAQATLAAVVGAPDPALDVASAPPTPAEMPDLSSAIQQAASRDPRLFEAFAQLKVEEERTRAIGAELRPDLSLTGTFSGRAGGAPPSGNGIAADGNGWLPNVANWDAGLVFTWPLLDATVTTRKEASRAEERVRREEIEAIRQQQVAAVRQAYVAVDVARTALPGLKRAVEAAEANYAQADARFRAGLGTSVELADAEEVRTEAEIQLALGQFELARARSAFGRTIAEGL